MNHKPEPLAVDTATDTTPTAPAPAPATPISTFACRHHGPPYPIVPVFWSSHAIWPPTFIPNRLCYACSIQELLNFINQHDAKIANWKQRITRLEYNLRLKAEPDPLSARQQIRTRKRQIELENKRWLYRLKHARKVWKLEWGIEMPKDLMYHCDRALVEVQAIKLRISTGSFR